MAVVGVNFNARTHVKSFTGLKAAASGSCESVSSFTRKESSAVLHHSFAWKNHNLSQTSSNVFQVKASFKLAILGAAARIGKSLCISPHPHDRQIKKDVV
ncbi:hypothetical protein Tco_1137646, partial [Tanacetum coccineum]